MPFASDSHGLSIANMTRFCFSKTLKALVIFQLKRTGPSTFWVFFLAPTSSSSVRFSAFFEQCFLYLFYQTFVFCGYMYILVTLNLNSFKRFGNLKFIVFCFLLFLVQEYIPGNAGFELLCWRWSNYVFPMNTKKLFFLNYAHVEILYSDYDMILWCI